MRKIKKPPKFEFSRIGPLLERHPFGPDAYDDVRYLHWDQIVRRVPPDGLTHEDWWQLLKFYRFGGEQLPLRDRHGKPFTFKMLDRMHEQLHRIDLGTGGTLEASGQAINREQRDRFYVSSLIEEAITSSQIEGASTTNAFVSGAMRLQRTGVLALKESGYVRPLFMHLMENWGSLNWGTREVHMLGLA